MNNFDTHSSATHHEPEENDELENDGSTSPNWKPLYLALVTACKRFGDEDFRGRADFWVVDDDWGGDGNQKVCVTSPSFLTPQVVEAIAQCVREAGFPGAQVMVSLELQRHVGDKLPPMGLLVTADGVTEQWDLAQIRKTVGDGFYRRSASS